MAKKTQSFEESQLTKGQARKLNALRRTLGDEDIARDAFGKWLAQPSQTNGRSAGDPNAEKIASAIQDLKEKSRISIPRGGYVVRSGRGRVIVEPAAETA